MAVSRRTARAGPVGGPQALGLVMEALEQLPDGPGAQAQGAGDGGRGLATACAALDQAAQGDRQWCRHGVSPRCGSGMTIAYSPAGARQNLFCRD